MRFLIAVLAGVLLIVGCASVPDITLPGAAISAAPPVGTFIPADVEFEGRIRPSGTPDPEPESVSPPADSENEPGASRLIPSDEGGDFSPASPNRNGNEAASASPSSPEPETAAPDPSPEPERPAPADALDGHAAPAQDAGSEGGMSEGEAVLAGLKAAQEHAIALRRMDLEELELRLDHEFRMKSPEPAPEPVAAFVGPPKELAGPDPELAETIKKAEGFSPEVYEDILGNRHIGYGWNLEAGISEEDARAQLDRAIVAAEVEARMFLGDSAFDDLNRQRRNAWIEVCLWTANLCGGYEAARDATLEGDWNAAARELLTKEAAESMASIDLTRASRLSEVLRTGERQP